GIGLPRQAAGREAAEVMQQTRAQQIGIAPGVEAERVRHVVVERRENARALAELHDACPALHADSGSGIDRHEGRHALGMANRVAKTVDAAHRHADEDKAAEIQPSHERLQVAYVRLGAVVGSGRPRRVTVPPLVERQAAVLAPERETDEVPGARRLTAAVEEEDGRPPGYAPVETVEGQAAQGELVGFRYDELVDRESRHPRCSPEVRELLCGREGDAWLRRRARSG